MRTDRPELRSLYFMCHSFSQPSLRGGLMIVMGVGNEFRHDDASGLIAARRLRALGVAAEEVEPDVAALIDCWSATDDVLLVDAVLSGTEPGTIHRLNVSTNPVPFELFNTSTHGLGLPEAIE